MWFLSTITIQDEVGIKNSESSGIHGRKRNGIVSKGD